jgi:chorismate mutase
MEHDPELERFRRAIDACNRDLCAALDERARLVRAVAAWKRARGLAALDPAREAEMSRRVRTLARADGYGPEALERIFEAILAESRAIALDEGTR